MNETSRLISLYCERRIIKHEAGKKKYTSPGSYFEKCIDERIGELQRLSGILQRPNWKEIIKRDIK